MPKFSDYSAEDLAVVEFDEEQGSSVEASFKSQADGDEGVSGRKSIDTTYENTSESVVTPRNEDAPRPIDLYRYPHRRL